MNAAALRVALCVLLGTFLSVGCSPKDRLERLPYATVLLGGTGPNDLWGTMPSSLTRPEDGLSVAHWNGEAWHRVHPAEPGAHGWQHVTAVAGPGALWLLDGNRVLRLERGGISREVPVPADGLFDIAGRGESLFGSIQRLGNTPARFVKLEGDDWVRLPTVENGLTHLRFVSDDEVWASVLHRPTLNPPELVARFDGTTWETFEVPFRSIHIASMVVAGEERWVVDEDIRMDHHERAGLDPARLAVLREGAWEQNTFPIPEPWAQSADRRINTFGLLTDGGRPYLLGTEFDVSDEFREEKTSLVRFAWEGSSLGRAEHLAHLRPCEPSCGQGRAVAQGVVLEGGSWAVTVMVPQPEDSMTWVGTP